MTTNRVLGIIVILAAIVLVAGAAGRLVLTVLANPPSPYDAYDSEFSNASMDEAAARLLNGPPNDIEAAFDHVESRVETERYLFSCPQPRTLSVLPLIWRYTHVGYDVRVRIRAFEVLEAFGTWASHYGTEFSHLSDIDGSDDNASALRAASGEFLGASGSTEAATVLVQRFEGLTAARDRKSALDCLLASPTRLAAEFCASVVFDANVDHQLRLHAAENLHQPSVLDEVFFESLRSRAKSLTPELRQPLLESVRAMRGK